jgi:hypothetical protein
MTIETFPVNGFPDYSRLGPNGGRLLFALTGALSGQPASGFVSTAGFAYLSLWTAGSDDGAVYTVSVTWANDQAGDETIGDNYYVPNDLSQNVVNTQVLTEWVSITHTLISGPGTAEPTTYVYGTTVAPIGSDIRSSGLLSLNVNPTLTAGANFTEELGGCGPGKLLLHVYQPNTTEWILQVKYFDTGINAVAELYQFPGTDWPLSHTIKIIVPPSTITLELTNQSAATEAFLLTCMPE